MQTLKMAVARNLRALAAWAGKQADKLDPPPVTTDGAGGPGPRPKK